MLSCQRAITVICDLSSVICALKLFVAFGHLYQPSALCEMPMSAVSQHIDNTQMTDKLTGDRNYIKQITISLHS